MRAISFMKTAVLAFALTALGGIQTVLADDATSTATFTLSASRGTVSASCSGAAGVGISQNGISGFNAVNTYILGYVSCINENTIGTISVNNFKYEVSNVEWKRWAILNAPEGNTYIKDGKGYESPLEPYNEVNVAGSVSPSLFVRDFTCNGITSFVIENNKNRIAISDITVTYYKPSIEFNEHQSTLYPGQSDQISVKYTGHQGLFTNDDITFSSSNTNVATVSSDGRIKAIADGTVKIIATVKNNNADVTSVSYDLNVQTYSVEEKNTFCCHSDESSDPTNKNDHDEDAKRVGAMKNNNDYTYTSTNVTTSNFTKFGEFQSWDSKRYRVGIQKLKSTITVPAYSSLDYEYTYRLETTGTGNYGAELFWLDENNISEYNNITIKTDDDAKKTAVKSSSYSLVRVTQNSNSRNSLTSGYKGGYGYTVEKTIDNSQNEVSKEYTYYLGLSSYIRHNNNNKTQTTYIWRQVKLHELTYYAKFSFNPNADDATGTMEDQTITSADTDKHLKQIGFTRNGYTFIGWSTEQNGSVKYTDQEEVNPYDEETDGGLGPVTLYAVWAGNTSTITFDAGNGYIKSGVSTNNNSSTSGNPSTWTINVKYGQSDGSKTWGSFAQPYVICDGFFFDGWYTKPDLSTDENSIENGEQVYDTKFQAVEGNFWKKSNNALVWKYGSITLYAHYTKKWTYSDGVITFIDRCKEEYSSDDEKAQSIGAAINECYTNYNAIIYDIMAENLEYVTPSKIGNVLKTAMENGEASKNVLVYCNDQVYSTEYNIIKNGTCPNLVVTDKEPMKITKHFKATNSSYTRSSTAKWGTLFLPFPISINNSEPIEYYELSSVGEDCMKFDLYKGTIIPANTPIVYCRTSTDAATVTMKNTNNTVTVPVSDMETTGSQTFGEWNLIGTRKTRVFYGPDYDASKLPEGATKQSATDIYCISNNKFYCLKNTGKATIDAYRAYFQYTNASSAKQTTFRIIVNEFDGATDITDILNGNESQGDGKIYDLNGRRIQTPLKGHLYIINGKKVLF